MFEGIVAYQHEVTAGKPLLNVELELLGVHDRAYVLTDGNFVQVSCGTDGKFVQVSQNVPL